MLGVAYSPLRLRAFYKTEDDGATQTLKVEYCYNSNIKYPLADVSFSATLDHATSCQANPDGKFDAGSKKFRWDLGVVSSTTAQNGCGILQVKWQCDAPVTGDVRFFNPVPSLWICFPPSLLSPLLW